MSAPVEILLTSDSSGAHWTCCAWDSKTGTSLMAYKGGGAAGLHGLCMLNDQFVISCNSTKPLIHIWPVNSQDQIQGTRFVTPGKVSCVAVTPDGNFLAAGVQETIHIWEICSGKMLAAISKHYQLVTAIKFTSDGGHFASASHDGSVLVWNFAKAVIPNETNHEPQYAFNDHALPVTDVHIGVGGIRAFMCTVSKDRTCRIYDLSSGTMLLNLVFAEPLSCVTMNALETSVYIGSSEGSIYEFNILSPPRMKEYHVNKDSCKQFLGHKGTVTCLAISIDGNILASGGADENVYLWHLKSRQLLKTIKNNGSLTNLHFFSTTRSIFNPNAEFPLVVSNLNRMLDKCNDSHLIEVLITEPVDYEMPSEHQTVLSTSDKSHELEELKQEVQKLKKANQLLFEFSTKRVLNEEPR